MTKSMNEHLIGMYAMTLDSAVNLLRDVECEDCATLPHEAAKHPAWVLGHLSVAAGMAIEILGGASPVPKTWASWSGPGQDPTADRSMYPKLSELVDTLRAAHGVLAEKVAGMSEAEMAAAFPIEDYRKFWPTVGDALMYLMGHHEGYHLGQMSMWRRAAGYGSVAMF